MEIGYIKIIETLVVLVLYILVKKVSNKLIAKNIAKKLMQNPRGVIVKKAINITFLVICITVIFIIWGVNQSDLAIYIGSILTVVGIAFFAQWSILSNITSSIIIFFNHSIKLNDTIAIMEEKDYEVVGKVIDIGLFFVTIVTEENEEISLPNNVFMQKLIRKINM